MSDVEFGKDYYRRVIDRYGYDPAEFDGFPEDLQNIGRLDLARIFLCQQGLYEFRDSESEKAVLTGFGLSGVPHLGTVSQINRIGLLNRAGYQAEVVLGDLDAYNGKLTSYREATRLAQTYERFISGTRLLHGTSSRVRNQSEYPQVLKTAYLLGRYATEDMFNGAEEDLHDFYSERGKVDSTMTYRRKLSLNLMIADFFHIGQERPEVLVMLGLDEHQYVRTAQRIGERLDTGECGLEPVRISSLYTPLIKGLRGFPKMSKSFPESGINLGMDSRQIEQLVMNEPDTYREPEDSVVFQIACGIGVGGETTLSEAYEAARRKGGEWYDIKKLLIGRIAMFSEIWREAEAA